MREPGCGVGGHCALAPALGGLCPTGWGRVPRDRGTGGGREAGGPDPSGGTGVSALGTEDGSVPVWGDGPAALRPPLGPDRGPGAGCAGVGGRGRDRRAGVSGSPRCGVAPGLRTHCCGLQLTERPGACELASAHRARRAAGRGRGGPVSLALRRPPRRPLTARLFSLQASFGSSSPVGSLSSEDHDFDPTAEMLVHDYDDERTLEEEEMMDEGKNFSSEIEDLEKEGSMPLEDLLAFYGYEPVLPAVGEPSANSSPGELADELPDMTLDKEEIAKDLLSGDDEETQSSADDLTPSVTSHEASDFFPRPLRSNTTCDGDKESEAEDVDTDSGNSPEDLRKEIMIGLQYQAEIPPYLGECDDNEEGSEGGDQLLWRPGEVAESKVKEYLVEAAFRTGNEKVADRASAGALTRDNEQALYELLKCDHNIKEAVERYCRSGKASQEGMAAWTEEECRSFEHALMLFGKDFHLIQKNKVRTRTVAECVAFYYMWKKSERYDYFAQQTRFGKKRYNHHPGVTDYMDRLVDETEALGGAVSSPVLTASRPEPVPDPQLNILNSFAAGDLTALTGSAATPGAVSCLDEGFPPLGSLPRGPVTPVPVATEELLTLPSNGESDCFNLFETGFYHSELHPLNLCSEEPERPAKRLKMGLAAPEPFLSEVSVNSLGVDFESHTHHIASAKMAVSVADFGSLSAGEANGFLSAHALHQHAALHSE